MNKRKIVILSLIVILFITGCQQKPSKTTQTTDFFNNKINGSNVLIAYFTWADNTYVDENADIDTDASSSASVIAPGNTKMIADEIQKHVGGDQFSIIVQDFFSYEYDKCLEQASDQLANQTYPLLQNKLNDFEKYDVIFIGYPNWWGRLPMPVMTFLKEYQFDQKTIIPFCSHGTGGLGRTVQDLNDLCPSSQILNPLGISRDEINETSQKVSQWLKDIGVE